MARTGKKYFPLQRFPLRVAYLAVLCVLQGPVALAQSDVESSAQQKNTEEKAKAAAAKKANTDKTSAEQGSQNDSFNPDFFSNAGKKVDLTRYERGNVVMPGTYRIDVFVNDRWAGITSVTFRSAAPQKNAQACYNRDLLTRANVNFDKISPEAIQKIADPAACVSLAEILPDAKEQFDSSDQRLDISIPQLLLRHAPKGYVNPEFWDQGVTAAMLNYNLNAYRSESDSLSQNNLYLGLDAGFNWDRWRFRQRSALNWQNDRNGSRYQWQNLATYVQTSIPSWGAQLTVGDSYTPNDIFDAVSIRGVQVGTDDRMLPDSMRGYAPTVRGVAETNARVSIRQRGILIYEATVPPGPFEISDLYASSYGGDLQVTVSEADGRQRQFAVPYSSVAQLLRPGSTRFNVTAGRLQQLGLKMSMELVQGTVQRGINNTLTVYGGAIAAKDYRSVLAGAAINTNSGALGADVTESQADIQGRTQNGMSLRLTYNVNIPKTDTNVAIAAYRYSTGGFLSLTDAATQMDIAARGVFYSPDRNRSRFSVNLNQKLGDRLGTLFLVGTVQNYWNRPGTDAQFQLGYNNYIGRLNYNVSVTRSKDPISNQTLNQFYVGVSMPLDDDKGHSKTVTASVTQAQPGGSSVLASYNATAGDMNQYSYGMSAAHDQGTGTSAGINGDYRGPYGRLSGTMSQSRNYSQRSFGAAGSIVAHSGGVILGQPLGETIGIVEAPDAVGAELTSTAGVTLNAKGYAIVPYLTPFSTNTVEISPKGLPMDVQLDATSREIAPYAGAIVKMSFKTSNKRMALIQSALPNGLALPFGAHVTDANNNEVGVVSQGGRIFAQLDADHGSLFVTWNGDDGEQKCTLSYLLPPRAKDGKAKTAYEIVRATCSPTVPAVASAAQNPATLVSRH